MAAVSEVFPWSTCPIVPMLTCGLVRVNLASLKKRLDKEEMRLIRCNRCIVNFFPTGGIEDVDDELKAQN